MTGWSSTARADVDVAADAGGWWTAPVHCVVSAALVRPGLVLLGHRHPGRRWYPDVWDLPGGHIEAGETETAALARELAEEIGVQVADLDPVPALRLASGPAGAEDAVRLGIWVVRSWVGEVVDRSPDEHDELRWVGPGELPHLRLADEAYLPFLLGLTGGRPAD